MPPSCRLWHTERKRHTGAYLHIFKRLLDELSQWELQLSNLLSKSLIVDIEGLLVEVKEVIGLHLEVLYDPFETRRDVGHSLNLLSSKTQNSELRTQHSDSELRLRTLHAFMSRSLGPLLNETCWRPSLRSFIEICARNQLMWSISTVIRCRIVLSSGHPSRFTPRNISNLHTPYSYGFDSIPN